MQVTLSEFKIDVGKYITLSEKEDVIVTRNGKQIARIVGTNRDCVADMKSLFGIGKLSQEYDDPTYDPNYEKLRDERMAE